MCLMCYRLQCYCVLLKIRNCSLFKWRHGESVSGQTCYEEQDVLKVSGATQTHQTFPTVGCSAHARQ